VPAARLLPQSGATGILPRSGQRRQLLQELRRIEEQAKRANAQRTMRLRRFDALQIPWPAKPV